MQGRKSYSQEEIEGGKRVVQGLVGTYQDLVHAVAAVSTDQRVKHTLEAFEPLYFNNMTLVLDRYFVHRLPGASYEGKDGNPLNEVRIICDSLMNNNGLLRADKQIKLARESSILKLQVGDPIQLNAASFTRLSDAFLTELQRRFT